MSSPQAVTATEPSHPAPTETLVEREIKDHLGLIAEMTQVFVASHDARSVATSALERITLHVGAEAASLFLVDDTQESLVCSACYGPVDITGIRITSETGIVGRAVKQQRGQMVRDVSADDDFGAAIDAKTGFTTRSILASPLSVGREALGAIEIINKVGGDGLFSTEDLVLLDTLARAAALAIHNFRLTDRLVEQERERHELELASEIQRDLLPRASARDFPIHGINVPARTVSGDFFDILPLHDGRIWFNVGDVSGKGMNAALLMAKTSSLFRCLAKSAETPGQLFGAINNELCETNSHGMFVTMVGGIFKPATGRVMLSNAGHEPPLLFHANDQRFTAIPADAPPLGIAADIAGSDGFPTVELDLGGGALYVFTDGLTEATTFGGGMLGIDGARALIRDHAGEAPDFRLKNIADAVKLPGQSLRDDLTLLVVEDNAPARAAKPMPAPDLDADDGVVMRLRLPARADRLRLVRAAADQVARFCNTDATWSADLVMAVDEACQNVIRHAYGARGESGGMVIEFVRKEDVLEVNIMDFAPPVDPETIKPRDLGDVRPGGLGVHLIRAACDDARFVPPPPGVGNVFKLTKRLGTKI